MSAAIEPAFAPALLGDPGVPAADRPPTRRTGRRLLRPAARLLAAAAGVLTFWYGATGLLLALERSHATRLLALAVAVVAGVAGLACTRAARHGDPARAGTGTQAVLGGALLWTCVSTAFYGGWVVGPVAGDPGGAPGLAPSLARAAAAIAATAYSTFLAATLLGAATLAAQASPIAGATRGLAPAPNPARYAPITFATLWAAHELAKLNVFVGVASPGAAYLPQYLAHLRQFFGPARNTPLLAVSVFFLATAAAVIGGRARRARGAPARRAALGLIASVVALAAFEHAMLGVRTPPGWWNAFVSWREAPR